jgi:hypothetical protein
MYKIDRFFYFKLVFLFAIFFPTFTIYSGNIGAIFINFTIIIACSIFILKYSKTNNILKINNPYVKIFFYLWSLSLLIMVLSYSSGFFFSNINIINRDIFELHRPVFYILVFTFTYLSFRTVADFIKYEKLLQFSFFIFIIAAYLQFNHLTPEILGLYTKMHNIDSGRVSVPFHNPYDYAFIMTFFNFYFIISYIIDGKKIKLLYFLISILLLLTTQSRALLSAFIFGFIIILPIVIIYLNFYKFKELKLNKIIIRFNIIFISTILLGILSIALVIEYFPYIVYGFTQLIEGERLNSASERLEQLLFAIDSSSKNPILFLIGHGPSKEIMQYVESYYAYGFYRYGIFGLFTLFILPVLLVIYLLIRVLKVIGADHKSYSLFLTVLVWFLVLPLSSIGNNFIEQLRISFFYYSLLAIVLRAYIVFKGNKI